MDGQFLSLWRPRRLISPKLTGSWFLPFALTFGLLFPHEVPGQVSTNTWNGTVNGNWDTTTTNWLVGELPATYSQSNFVIFDDTLAGTTNVILTTTLTPGRITVNNSLSNYVFSGSGSLGGAGSLIKSGA